MKLDARMLTFADPFMTGPDVDRLHEELSQLRDPYQKLVLADVDPDGRHRFGENTKKAVAAFQEKYRERLQAITVRSLDGREDVRWSGEWGVVDPATAQVINEVVQSLTVPFVIRGRVELEDGTPLPGARVVAFDRDIGSVREELGKKDGAYVTNANGGFPDIQYSVEAYAGGEGKHGASADLVFEVTGLEKPDAFELVAIYRTIPWPGRAKEERVADLVRGFRALPVETVRLVVRRRGELNPSEYERLMAALKPLLIGEITPARFDEDQHRDYSFAADETGVPRALIEMMAQAWRLADTTRIAPEMHYGLLRRGPPTRNQPMPPDLAGLLSYLRAVWQAKLIEAFELNLIPASGREEMPRWLDSLQKLQAQALLTDTADKKQASLADLLRYSRIPADTHVSFAELLNVEDGIDAAFWEKVAARLDWTPVAIQAAREAIDLANVVEWHQPLLALLYGAVAAPSTRVLAWWDREKLQSLIAEAGIPPDTVGATPEEQRSNYRDAIEGALKELHPAAYVAKALRRVADRDITAANDWLQRVLAQTNPLPEGVPPFDIVATPATKYLRDHGDRLFVDVNNEDRTRLASQLKRVQRVFQLTPDPDLIPRLFELNLDSARQISRWSTEHFVERFGEAMGGAEAAAAVHSKAGHIQATLLNLYVDMWKARQDFVPAGLERRVFTSGGGPAGGQP